jgi:integrase
LCIDELQESNTKYKWLQDLNAFYSWAGIESKPPDLKRVRTQPYLPPLESILFLIDTLTKLDFKLAVFLQLMKETAARAGEAWMVKWSDIEFKQRLIAIAAAEKGSRQRTRAVSHRLIDMLNLLYRKSSSPYVFHGEFTDPEGYTGALDDFRRQFERLRNQLDELSPTHHLKSIHFHSFRTWRATWEYYQTKDSRHVMDMLGIVNPWVVQVYIQLAQAIQLRESDFDVKQARNAEEATELGSIGYEKFDEFGDVHLYRKLKFLVEEPLKLPAEEPN